MKLVSIWRVRLWLNWIEQILHLLHFPVFTSQLYDKIRRSEQKYKVAIEVLSYHSKAPDDEIGQYKKISIPKEIPDLTE